MRRRLRAFARDEGASLSVEAVIVMPVLLWALMATYVFWDGYRVVTRSLTASYTVADLISRERGAIDGAYLDGMRGVLDALADGGRTGGQGRDGPAALRVAVVRNPTKAEESDAEVLTLECADASGDIEAVTDIAEIRAHVPALADGDRIVVLETLVPWSPIMGVGLPARRFESVVVTRPRFGGRVCADPPPPA